MALYVYRNGGLVEVERVAPGPRVFILTDRQYEDLRPVPVGLDKDKHVQTVNVSSRTKHREFMEQNGLALADDFKGTWAAAEQERATFASGGEFQVKERREALERAMYQAFESPGVQERPKEWTKPVDGPGEDVAVVKSYLPHEAKGYST
jgi:hypothetical protein